MRQDPDIEISLAGEEATIDLGAKLALNLRAGDCISLIGDLGAGKTTLSRGLIQALMGADTEVPSPTYTIVQTYETDPAPIWHFDLYRIEWDEDGKHPGKPRPRREPLGPAHPGGG